MIKFFKSILNFLRGIFCKKEKKNKRRPFYAENGNKKEVELVATPFMKIRVIRPDEYRTL